MRATCCSARRSRANLALWIPLPLGVLWVAAQLQYHSGSLLLGVVAGFALLSAGISAGMRLVRRHRRGVDRRERAGVARRGARIHRDRMRGRRRRRLRACGCCSSAACGPLSSPRADAPARHPRGRAAGPAARGVRRPRLRGHVDPPAVPAPRRQPQPHPHALPVEGERVVPRGGPRLLRARRRADRDAGGRLADRTASRSCGMSMERYAAATIERPALARIIQQEAARPGPRFDYMYEHYIGPWRRLTDALLHALQEEGVVRPRRGRRRLPVPDDVGARRAGKRPRRDGRGERSRPPPARHGASSRST